MLLCRSAPPTAIPILLVGGFAIVGANLCVRPIAGGDSAPPLQDATNFVPDIGYPKSDRPSSDAIKNGKVILIIAKTVFASPPGNETGFARCAYSAIA